MRFRLVRSLSHLLMSFLSLNFITLKTVSCNVLVTPTRLRGHRTGFKQEVDSHVTGSDQSTMSQLVELDVKSDKRTRLETGSAWHVG